MPAGPNGGSTFGRDSRLTGMVMFAPMPGLVLVTREGTPSPLFLYLSTPVAPLAVHLGGENPGLPIERGVSIH